MQCSFDIETESRWMQPGRENRRSTSDCYRGGSILMQHIVPAAQLAPNCRGTELPTWTRNMHARLLICMETRINFYEISTYSAKLTDMENILIK
uniref:Uncharacterized protein n=1 Tax=Onchocerca volvulus TaxID=6282 RepID=A0A8R1XYL9_ONCVO